MIKTLKITLKTRGSTDIIDITPEIRAFVSEADITDGVVSVFVKGSTGAVTTIEFEPNMVKDFKNAMDRIIPAHIKYEHAETWNDDNGHSHIRAAIVGCSQTVPVSGGELLLGTWQQVVIVDFDTRARNREVILTCVW